MGPREMPAHGPLDARSNHIGHFLLTVTVGLVARLAECGRVIVVSGHAHRYAREADRRASVFPIDLSMIVDNQRHTGEAEMKVRRPAHADAEYLHHMKPYRVSERQILIREPAQDADTACVLLGSHRNNAQGPQLLDERDELQRA